MFDTLFHLLIAILVLGFIGYLIQIAPLSPLKTFESAVRLVLWIILVLVSLEVLLPFVGIHLPS